MRCTGRGVIALCAIVGVLVGLPAGAQSHTPLPTILARSDADFAQRARDIDLCRAVARDAPAEDLPRSGLRAGAGGYGGYAGLDVAIGAAIAFAIIAAIETERSRGVAQSFCMFNLGYAAVPLTPDEATQYRSLRGEDREDWERRLMGAGMADRVAAVRARTAPELPPYTDAPATLGGIRINVDSLQPASAPVPTGGVLATGQITRWRTAVLTEDFTTADGPVRLKGVAAAVFHQVDFRPQRDPLLRDQGATWCGPVSEVSSAGPDAPNQLWCFTSHLNGYDVFRPTGYPWLAGPYRDGIVLPRFEGRVILEEREQDDLGPIEFEVRLGRMTRTTLQVDGVALRGGRNVHIFSHVLDLSVGSEAVLPLWHRRLLLARDRSGVSARIDDAGPGRGWRA